MIFITGRVKLTSEMQIPFPIVRSKPQFTGLGEVPKMRSCGLETAKVLKFFVFVIWSPLRRPRLQANAFSPFS